MEPLKWEDVPAFMAELRAMARRLLSRESAAQALRTSDLVQSALLRLLAGDRQKEKKWDEVSWEDRDAFFAAACVTMRRVLTDRARYRKRGKRDERRTVSLGDLALDNLLLAAEEEPDQMEALAEALASLRSTRPRWAQMIEYQYLLGFGVGETAGLMEVNEGTLREWRDRALPWLAAKVLSILNA